MAKDGEDVPQFLARMRARDLEKGGVGYRTTREIADFFGVSAGKMRRHLDRLYEADLIDCAQEDPGLPIDWIARH